MTAGSLPGGKSPRVTPYRIVVSLLLALAAATMYIAFVSSKSPEPDITNSLNVLDVRPAANSTVLRQTRIFAKLKTGFVGSLIVEGIEIPADQVDHLEGVNTVGFTPGPNTATGALRPGHRCAVVFYWKADESRVNAQQYRWCWEAH
ncbi:MAG TPA: hypothetical protein VHC63_10550 [Acidimicrobiales bacterium]|nr:hypothetical protein [Acidimicrobiales bacterium]